MKNAVFSFAVALSILSGAAHASDPATDKLVFTGNKSVGAYSITFANNKYSLGFAGDEVITYTIDLSDPQNAGGMLRIRELTSDSYPMDGAGFIFKDPGGLFWFPKDNYKKTTLIGHSASGKKLTLDYRLDFNGTHLVRYEITQEGKGLRVRMLDPTGNTNASSNFSGVVYGASTGVETPKLVRMQGTLAWPIVLFRKPTAQGNQHFFTANMLDMFQTNSCDYGLFNMNNPTIGADSIICNYTTSTQYKPMSNGMLAAPLDDTYLVIVSGRIKDVLLTSTAPPSPYHGLLVNRMVFNGPEHSWQWYLDMMDQYMSWGMYNLAGYLFEWSGAIKDPPATINVGPDWYPALDPAKFAALMAKSRQYGILFGAYSAFNCVPQNAPSSVYHPEEFVRDAAGNVKTYTNLGFPLLGVEASGPHAQAEIGKLQASGASAVYLDIQTYGNLSKAPDGDHMDQQATSPWAKTLKQGFAAQKAWFAEMKDTLTGPLLGEGSIATVNSNQEFLWYGYVDSVQRCINTAGGANASTLPAGSPFAPTNYPIIPEYEWRVAAVEQVNHGNGFYDRFFGKSDGGTIVNMSTGLPNFPLSEDAQDLYQAFVISYGHSGYVTTNGNQQVSGEGYLSHAAAAKTYFMTNALQTYYFTSPIAAIRYLNGGEWKSFEEVLFASETTDTFRHIPIALQFANGLKIYVNHGSTSLNVTEGGVTYTLPAKTGYFAGLPGLLTCFSAIAPGTNGKRIDYCRAPGQYEYFNGRGQVSAYGSISTAAKRSKWNVASTNVTITEDAGGMLAVAQGTKPAITNIVLVPGTSTMKKGDRVGLRAVAIFSNGSALDVTTYLDWFSAKKNVATVNSGGVIEAMDNGACKIYAMLPSGGTLAVPVNVKVQ